MHRYVTIERFKELTIMPTPDVDAVEELESDWIQRRLDRWAARLNARLIKRYAVPFGDPPTPPAAERTNVPFVIEDWIVALVTLEAYSKRGFNPSSEMDQAAIVAPATEAKEEIEQAANSETGLYELPLRATETAGGVTKGGPLGYSETSPYVGFSLQGDAGRAEDRARSGT